MSVDVAASQPPKRTFAQWRRDFIVTNGGKMRGFFDRLIAPWSTIPNTPILDLAMFPGAEELEANWEIVRDEFLALQQSERALPPLADISPDHASIAEKTKWRAFFFYGYRMRVDKNCAKCPKTAALLDRFPGLETAMFSVMSDGTYVPHHRGVTKATLKFHLPLILPRDMTQCFIEVDGQNYRWSQGKMFIFDDCYRHAVTNKSGDERAILLLEVRRPLRWPGTWFADFFMWCVTASPFVQDARRNIHTWKVD